MPPPADFWTHAGTFEFAGVALLDSDVEGAVASVQAAVEARAPQGLHLCNAYTLALASRDSEYRAALQHPGAVNLPDGTPVAWFYRLSHRRPARGPVRGPSLMKAVLAQTSLRHFLLGGDKDVLVDLEAEITRRYPNATVVGSMSPPFRDPTEAELDDWTRQVNRSGADIVWIGLGTPRQDLVISRLVGRSSAILVGVGAAFDFLSGHKPEAPRLLHGTGLEWIYRLCSEPRRLWRRYLLGNTIFLTQAMREMSRRKPPISRR